MGIEVVVNAEDRRIYSLDRISQLPEDIIHAILVHLPTKQAAQTSVLCKICLRAWKSYTVLDFDQNHFKLPWDSDENRREYKKSLIKFVRVVDRSIRSFNEKNLRMKRFRISIKEDYADHLDKWIGIAMESLVEELDVTILKGPVSYSLPHVVFGATFLKGLSLSRCNLNLPLSITLNSIKKLVLYDVCLNDVTLTRLTTNCPYMEDFVLDSCSGLISLEISGHHLKTLEIFDDFGFEKLVVEAPNLAKIHSKSPILLYIEIKFSSSLRDLELLDVDICDQWLSRLIEDSPLLERLRLVLCDTLQLLKISGDRLLEVRIKNCDDLVETHIDAPNLRVFKYSGRSSVMRIIPQQMSSSANGGLVDSSDLNG